jgi:hypothetical protein
MAVEEDVKIEIIRPKVSLVPCVQHALSVCAQASSSSWCWMHFATSATSLQLMAAEKYAKLEMNRPKVSLVPRTQLALSV